MAVQFKYIATNPQVLGGKPMIKGTRISVEFILELVASGASVKDIVAAYPDLPEEAVKEAMSMQRHRYRRRKKTPLLPLSQKVPLHLHWKIGNQYIHHFFSHQSGIIILWEGGVLVFSGFAHIGRDGNACFLHFRKER
ncbi:MAG: DUF433 domain-containing protein [Haliscomenobacter sp.]|nr:DUF433 domain-containing protein [Haliscomenobacter sp.]